MSEREEPRIRCVSCRKSAPAMKYCIYCGAKLRQVVSPVVDRPAARTLWKSKPFITPMPPTVQPPKLATPSPENKGLICGISALYVRKNLLLELLKSGEVSERVFLKLYDEYRGKLADFMDARETKLKKLKGNLEAKSNRLSEISTSLEELESRYKADEINAIFYNKRIETFNTEEQELVDSSKTLRTNILGLEKLLSDKRPNEIRDLEAKLKESLAALDKMVEEGKATDKTLKAVKPDVEEALKLLDFLVKERKGKEKQLREQLETLQTRHKLNELSIEEYERRKRELQAKIDKLWA